MPGVSMTLDMRMTAWGKSLALVSVTPSEPCQYVVKVSESIKGVDFGLSQKLSPTESYFGFVGVFSSRT